MGTSVFAKYIASSEPNEGTLGGIGPTKRSHVCKSIREWALGESTLRWNTLNITFSKFSNFQ
jgi:hypothetical protein